MIIFTLCEFHSFLWCFFGVVGLSIICAMFAERYLAICCPYTYQRWGIDQHFARKCLFCIYLSNIAFCCLPVMGMAGSICQPSKTWCFINWRADKTLPATYSFLYASENPKSSYKRERTGALESAFLRRGSANDDGAHGDLRGCFRLLSAAGGTRIF